jgi:SAM-dependent methyltransferase
LLCYHRDGASVGLAVAIGLDPVAEPVRGAVVAGVGLDIEFMRADATDLTSVGEAEFDLVCSTNGFFVWVSELDRVFSAVHEALKPGGYYILYDVHPFLRPWKDQVMPIEMEKPYFETGPFEYEESAGTAYEFNWTLSDIVNALVNSGLMLRKMVESPAKDSRFWQDFSYQPGTDESLLDWKTNPRAGLPSWLTLAVEKPHNNRMQTEGNLPATSADA